MRFYMLLPLLISVFACMGRAGSATQLPGFEPSGQWNEQVKSQTFEPGVEIVTVAPSAEQYDPTKPVLLILYALPVGNSIEWTRGKRRSEGMDWHYDIQHIDAQTRMLRTLMPEKNVVVVYLLGRETDYRSWPRWRQMHENNAELIQQIVAEVSKPFPADNTQLVLTGHSGGGSFTFGYLNGVDRIPAAINRIAFLDSNYGYSDDEKHGDKIIEWLQGDPTRQLVVIAYDDREVKLNGKSIVSDTGGTWRATQRMVDRLGKDYDLKSEETESLLHQTAPQIEIIRHKNPEVKILHTTLVGEMNGYLHAMVVGTAAGDAAPPFGIPRAYDEFIEGESSTSRPAITTGEIPARKPDAMSGSAFIDAVKDLPLKEREAAILRELTAGNIPDFLRHTVTINVEADGVDSVRHRAEFETMPDYLAIGSDEDFVRMPMTPMTAQAFCDEFGFMMPTRRIAELAAEHATVRLEPQPLTEAREAPAMFLHHNRLIQEQLGEWKPGVLVSGIKKDVVITNRLLEKPNRVAIYGWHYPDGKAIQPLSIVHHEGYVDYSHGIRPVRRLLTVDGKALSMEDVLQDPHLHVLLSDEGEFKVLRYGQE